MLSPNMLDQSVRQVRIQFSFSNEKFVPSSIRQVADEPMWERNVRKNATPGVQIVNNAEKSEVREFIGDLEAADYELIDAFSMRRNKPNGDTYSMVRFVFVRKEFANPSDQFIAIHDLVRSSLITMCEAMWRVRAYNNPYGEGEERAMSINLEVREPLFRPDGTRVTARLKDEQGRPYGEPVPLSPVNELRIINNKIEILPYK